MRFYGRYYMELRGDADQFHIWQREVLWTSFATPKSGTFSSLKKATEFAY